MRIDSDGECRCQFLMPWPDGTNKCKGTAGFLQWMAFWRQVIETIHLFACSRVAEVKALLACMGHKTFI
jgi:hypothetical protein